MYMKFQGFLGLTNYFRKFVENYAIKSKPLCELLNKNSKFEFTDKCREAFIKLKDDLMSYPVLCLYRAEAETELHTDASSHGIAGILVQKQNSGSWAAFSQATNKGQANYRSFELEILAIVKAMERFHIYLYGIEFTADCNALVYAINKANLNPRITR